MKKITGRELQQLPMALYAPHDEGDFPENLYIKYGREKEGSRQIVEEPFPLTCPEFNECIDYFQERERWNNTPNGVSVPLSTLETTRDACAIDDLDEDIYILYEVGDIDSMISKLIEVKGWMDGSTNTSRD